MSKPLWIEEILCVHNQSLVSSCQDFLALNRYLCVFNLSCLHFQTTVGSSDFHAFAILSCAHVRSLVSSPKLRAFMLRILGVHNPNFVHSSSVVLALMSRQSGIRYQTFVRSSSIFHALASRHPCVHQTFCLLFGHCTRLSWVHAKTSQRSWSKFQMFNIPGFHQTILRSHSELCASKYRLWCVQVMTFFRSADFRPFLVSVSCVHIQKFVSSAYFWAFMFNWCCFLFKILCVHKNFACCCQIFVHSGSDVCELMS